MKQFLVPIRVDKVTGLSLPTELSDATNKEYVDSFQRNFTATIPANSTASVFSIPTDFRSLLLIMDIVENTTETSMQVFIKSINSNIDFIRSNIIGDSNTDIDFLVNNNMANMEFVNYNAFDVTVYVRIV